MPRLWMFSILTPHSRSLLLVMRPGHLGCHGLYVMKLNGLWKRYLFNILRSMPRRRWLYAESLGRRAGSQGPITPGGKVVSECDTYLNTLKRRDFQRHSSCSAPSVSLRIDRSVGRSREGPRSTLASGTDPLRRTASQKLPREQVGAGGDFCEIVSQGRCERLDGDDRATASQDSRSPVAFRMTFE